MADNEPVPPPNRSDKVARVIVETYPCVKDAVLRLEVFVGHRSRRSVYEMRDALDHIYECLNPAVPDDEAEKNVHDAEDHLRRAAVEPAEYIAEENLRVLNETIKKRRGILGSLFIHPRAIPPAIRRSVNEGKVKLLECRKLKAQRKTLPQAVDAALAAAAAFEDASHVLGPQHISAVKVAIVFGAIGSVIGGVVVALLLKCIPF